MPYFHFFTAIMLLNIACQDSPKDAALQSPPVSVADQRLPENALRGLEVRDGLVAQLFASEPLVRNPSNIDVDHRGRVWVVENVNYRPENNPDNKYQDGGDMVVILEDTDGDGRADNRKVFYQDLLVDGAMGIGVFGNQIYLSSSPHILILTDDDHDDQADRVDTLFTGMGNKQGDHTVHAVSFGPDGRLYFNYGNAGKKMLYKDGRPVIDKMGNRVDDSGDPYRHGMVFRCEMDGSNVESLGHNFRNNYEVCVDSYGRMWQSDNDDDGNKSVRINYVMEYGNFGYRDELTGASWQTSRSGWHSEIPSRHWHQNDPGVVPNLYITGSGSPCGITLYEGDLLPPIFQSQLLHADAGPGALWAFPMKDQGAGFEATEEHLLMRKTDAWYRPTDVCTAPDGSLFMSDWYDPGVGGHWAGDANRGRIFRISVPTAKRYIVPEATMDTPESAVESLKSPNAATRYLAWMAIAKFGEQAITDLNALWHSTNSVLRARALWLLTRVNENVLVNALEDEDAMIRSTAVRVARLVTPHTLVSLLRPMLRDPSPKVRREIATALREMKAEEVPAYWASLATQHDGQDRWYLEALGIGATNRWDDCLQAWLSLVGDEWDSPAGRDIIWRSRSSKSFNYLKVLLSNPDLSSVEQARYLRATDFVSVKNKDEEMAALLPMDRKDKVAFQEMLLTHLTPGFARQSAEVKNAVHTLLPEIRGTKKYLDLVGKLELKEEIAHLFQMVVDKPNHELGVSAAFQVIRLDGWERFAKEMKGPLQNAMIQVLSHVNQTPAKQLLKSIVLDDDEEMSVRKKAVESLSIDWGWNDRMIDLINDKSLDSELAAFAATKLMSAARASDRAAGIKYLEGLPGGVQGVDKLASIEELITRNGKISDGKVVFKAFCSNCHRVAQDGVEFGPDLSDIGNKLGKDGLYTSIIYPSAAVSHGYEGFHFELKDGTHHSGYLLQEDQGEITLKMANGVSQTFTESAVATKEALPASLMTPGLAQVMGEEKLVDLVAYLSNLIDRETLVSNPFQGKIGYEREE